MNKIQKMLQDLCPNGVEWKTLGEVAELKAGKSISASQIFESQSTQHKFPCFGGNGIRGYVDSFSHHGEFPIIGRQGALCGCVNYANGEFYATEHAVVAKPKGEVLSRYLFYVLQNADLNQYKTQGAQPGLSVTKLNDIVFPIPPLPVQVEIVNFLDKFTQLSADLQAELKKELKLRRKQYDYYRNHLLSFDSNSTTVQWMPLGEVAEYAKGRIAIEDIDEINYVSVENLLQDRQGVTIASSIPNMESCIRFLPNDILIGNIRPYLRKIWLADKEGGTNGDVLTVRIKSSYKESLLPRFLYHNLASESFFLFDNQHAKGAKMPRGDKNAVMQYLIPIPPIAEQERIVGILDKFETLVNDLSKGLPAEIALVQKQYEYYRNLLLTFE